MGLKQEIEADIKKAMLAKNQPELLALRSIKSMILLAETEKNAADTLSEDVEMKLLQKAAKQRKESAETFGAQGRKDLEEKELFELSIIERYLPKQMSADELEAAVKDIIAQVGATTAADMGKVMGVASKILAGKADGKVISETVKKLLA